MQTTQTEKVPVDRETLESAAMLLRNHPNPTNANVAFAARRLQDAIADHDHQRPDEQLAVDVAELIDGDEDAFPEGAADALRRLAS